MSQRDHQHWPYGYRQSSQPPSGPSEDHRFTRGSTMEPSSAVHRNHATDFRDNFLSPRNKANQRFYAKQKVPRLQVLDFEQWPEEEVPSLSSLPFGQKRDRNPEESSSSKRPRVDTYSGSSTLMNPLRNYRGGYGDPPVQMSPHSSYPVYHESTRHSRSASVQRYGDDEGRSSRTAHSVNSTHSNPPIEIYRAQPADKIESGSGYSCLQESFMSPPSHRRNQLRTTSHDTGNASQRSKMAARIHRASTAAPSTYPSQEFQRRATSVAFGSSTQYGDAEITNHSPLLGSPIYRSTRPRTQGFAESSGWAMPKQQLNDLGSHAVADTSGSRSMRYEEKTPSIKSQSGHNPQSDAMATQEQAQHTQRTVSFVGLDDDNEDETLETTLGRCRKERPIPQLFSEKTVDAFQFCYSIPYDRGRRQNTPALIEDTVIQAMNSIGQLQDVRTPEITKPNAAEVIDLVTPIIYSHKGSVTAETKNAIKTGAVQKRKFNKEAKEVEAAENIMVIRQKEAVERINQLKRQGERQKVHELFDEEVENEYATARRLRIIEEEAIKKHARIQESIVKRHTAALQQDLSDARKKAAAADAQRISKEVNAKKLEMRSAKSDQLKQEDLARLDERHSKAAKLLLDQQNEARARDAQRDEEDRKVAELEAEVHEKRREQREAAKKTASTLKPAKKTNARIVEEAPPLLVQQSQSDLLPMSDMFVGEDEQIPRVEEPSTQIGNNSSLSNDPIAIVESDGRRKPPTHRSRAVSRAVSRPIEVAEINALKRRNNLKWAGQRKAELEAKERNALHDEQRQNSLTIANEVVTEVLDFLTKALEDIKKQFEISQKESLKESQKAMVAFQRNMEQKIEALISAKLTAHAKTTNRVKPIEQSGNCERLSQTFSGLASDHLNHGFETMLKSQAEIEARERALAEECRRVGIEKKEKIREKYRERRAVRYREKQEQKLRAEINFGLTEAELEEQLDVLEAEYRKAQLDRIQKKANDSFEDGAFQATATSQPLDSDDDDKDDSPEAQIRKAQLATVRKQIDELKTFNQSCHSFASAASKKSSTNNESESEESEEDPDDEPDRGLAGPGNAPSLRNDKGQPRPGKELIDSLVDGELNTTGQDMLNPGGLSADVQLKTLQEDIGDLQITPRPFSDTTSHISVGPPDTEMINIYSVQRISTVGGVASKPVIIKMFVDREEANKFANNELLKVRWGPANDIRSLSVEFEKGLFSGHAIFDKELGISEDVDVTCGLKFTGDLANFDQRQLRPLVESHSYLVSEFITKPTAASMGPDGDIDMDSSDDESSQSPTTPASSDQQKVQILKQSHRVVGHYTDRSLANKRASQHFLRLIEPVGGTIDSLVEFHNVNSKNVRDLVETLDADIDDEMCFDVEKMMDTNGTKIKVLVEKLEVQGPRN